MFLLVSVRHVGAHPDGHQHGVSIQISINSGKTFLPISGIWNIPLTYILARVFAYLPPLISQPLDFISVLNGFDFFLSILNGVTLKTSNCTRWFACSGYLGGLLPYMANTRMCRRTERCQSTESRHTRHKRAIIKRHLISKNRNIHL